MLDNSFAKNGDDKEEKYKNDEIEQLKPYSKSSTESIKEQEKNPRIKFYSKGDALQNNNNENYE